MAKRVCYSQKLLVIGLFRLAFEWTDEEVQGNLGRAWKGKNKNDFFRRHCEAAILQCWIQVKTWLSSFIHPGAHGEVYGVCGQELLLQPPFALRTQVTVQRFLLRRPWA